MQRNIRQQLFLLSRTFLVRKITTAYRQFWELGSVHFKLSCNCSPSCSPVFVQIRWICMFVFFLFISKAMFNIKFFIQINQLAYIHSNLRLSPQMVLHNKPTCFICCCCKPRDWNALLAWDKEWGKTQNEHMPLVLILYITLKLFELLLVTLTFLA